MMSEEKRDILASIGGLKQGFRAKGSDAAGLGTFCGVRLIRSPNRTIESIRALGAIRFPSFPACLSTIGSPLNSKLNLNHRPSPIDDDGICAHSSLAVELWHDGGPLAGNQDPRLALFIEPLDSQVREMARPSSILAALQAEKVLKTCKFTPTSMLKSLRIVGRIPGGLDRPRPSFSWRDQETKLIDSYGIESAPRSTTGRYQMTPRTASTK